MDQIRELNKKTIEQFREHRGGGPLRGRPLLLLTTRGRKSGRPYTTPVMYRPDGDRLLVFASCMGAPSHPDWYLNLVADPKVTVEVGAETYEATAVVVTGEERERLWAVTKEQYPFFTEHEARTEREIPVIALERLP
ncbi:nitroreductase family deazaflavin-dependent oxidoreductase [Microtetraspora glauca]|uniref:Nitroreductase family deazaflavin-dependent oxidoreductase n=1 Tax=Microtetraspora glauca TaxID=1996 RepID=A0ABV3GTY2_MICGL